MANKRTLKKNIAYACGDVAGVCVFSEKLQNADPEKVAQIIVNIASLQAATKKNVSFSFDRTPKDFDNSKAYRAARSKYFRTAYATLKKDFDESLGEIINDMNKLSKE